MELKLETEEFEKLQTAFIGEVVDSVKVKLQAAGLQDRQLEEVTAGISTSIASIIDDMKGIESEDGTAVKPYLTFRGSDNELIHCGENSYSYDFVFEHLKRLFDV
ncbi:MAG: hypothetical protein GY694_02400 [Gammaproteobacteria bacterium]|nr:hypothetical protein [Gammaproteobacteria bacterium]